MADQSGFQPLREATAFQVVEYSRKTRQMAVHASIRTTQLYDRREERVTLDEVVKIDIRG
jgi:hypothetical protein